MSVAATSDVPWLSVLTPATAGVTKGQTASFSFDVVPDSMLALQSPYVGHIRVQDLNDPASFIIATVTVLVLPRPQIQVNTNAVSVVWSISTQTPSVANLVVTNSGPATSSLNWSATKLAGSAWLSVLPSSGGPLDSGATATLAVSVVAASVPQLVGSYVETVRIASPNASNGYVDVLVTLTVEP
jgi:hypothetical protein